MAPLTGTTDTDLPTMRRIANREEAALGELFDRHAPVVMALGFRMLGERSEAEDLTEAVFWDLWRRADRYNPSRGSVGEYLLTLARRRAIERLRTDPENLSESARTDRQEHYEHAARAEQPEPAQRPHDQQHREQVTEALQQLTNDQRRALEGICFDGLTCTRIADRQNESPDTIRNRIHEALRQLQRLLRPDEAEQANGGTADLMLFYAAGTFDESQRVHAERRLAARDPEARGELRSAEGLLSELAFALQPITPGSLVRRRLLTRAAMSQQQADLSTYRDTAGRSTARRGRRRTLVWMLIVALLAALIASILTAIFVGSPALLRVDRAEVAAELLPSPANEHRCQLSFIDRTAL